jgi:hypothetical protein
MTTMTVEEGLRAWAKGLYPCEAAVELTIRYSSGWLADERQPWVFRCDNGYYGIDPDKLMANSGAFSGGERRMVAVIVSLLDGSDCRMPLSDVSGLDREALDLVLAALAHAGGSHEHSVPVWNGTKTGIVGFDSPGSLHPWPGE